MKICIIFLPTNSGFFTYQWVEIIQHLVCLFFRVFALKDDLLLGTARGDC